MGFAVSKLSVESEKPLCGKGDSVPVPTPWCNFVSHKIRLKGLASVCSMFEREDRDLAAEVLNDAELEGLFTDAGQFLG